MDIYYLATIVEEDDYGRYVIADIVYNGHSREDAIDALFESGDTVSDQVKSFGIDELHEIGVWQNGKQCITQRVFTRHHVDEDSGTVEIHHDKYKSLFDA